MPTFERLTSILVALVLPAAALAAWEIAARTGAVNPTFLPPPSAVAATVVQIVASGAFAAPLLHTLTLLLAGYAIGCGMAILLGLAMGYYPALYNLFEPLVELLRPIPKPALLPPLILFLGLGPAMEVTLIALGCFFPVLINTLQGARSVDPTMIDMARTFGHRINWIFRYILLPACAPYTLAGMRVSLGLGLILVVIAEMMSGTGGLGDVILQAQRSFLVKESYGWLVVLTVVGLALTSLFNLAERRLVFWSAAEGRP